MSFFDKKKEKKDASSREGKKMEKERVGI